MKFSSDLLLPLQLAKVCELSDVGNDFTIKFTHMFEYILAYFSCVKHKMLALGRVQMMLYSICLKDHFDIPVTYLQFADTLKDLSLLSRNPQESHSLVLALMHNVT